MIPDQNSGRLIIEMGMGTDVSGQNYTLAATRAVQNAIQHSNLSILKVMQIDPADIRIVMTLGVQRPDQVDTAKLPQVLGQDCDIQIVQGGLDSVDPETGDLQIVASAAVEVFLPKQTGWALRKAE